MKELKIKNSDEKYSVGKIVCIGRNYAKHAEEMGSEVLKFPLIFLKPASSLIFSGEPVIFPENSGELHHEVELVLLIGKDVKNASDEEAEDAIAGYGVGLDMTLRTVQHELKAKGHPWTLAKVFDTSAVLSDIVLKKDYQLKGNERIKVTVNEMEKQNSTLDYMLFNSVEIVKYISAQFTLEKGDLIFTGTPEGVGPVDKTDRLYASIENLAELNTEIK